MGNTPYPPAFDFVAASVVSYKGRCEPGTARGSEAWEGQQTSCETQEDLVLNLPGLSVAGGLGESFPGWLGNGEFAARRCGRRALRFHDAEEVGGEKPTVALLAGGLLEKALADPELNAFANIDKRCSGAGRISTYGEHRIPKEVIEDESSGLRGAFCLFELFPAVFIETENVLGVCQGGLCLLAHTPKKILQPFPPVAKQADV